MSLQLSDGARQVLGRALFYAVLHSLQIRYGIEVHCISPDVQFCVTCVVSVLMLPWNERDCLCAHSPDVCDCADTQKRRSVESQVPEVPTNRPLDI